MFQQPIQLPQPVLFSWGASSAHRASAGIKRGRASDVAPPGDQRELVVVGSYPGETATSPVGEEAYKLDGLAKNRAGGGSGDERDARTRPVAQPSGDGFLPTRRTPRHPPRGGGSWLRAPLGSCSSVGPHRLTLPRPVGKPPGIGGWPTADSPALRNHRRTFMLSAQDTAKFRNSSRLGRRLPIGEVLLRPIDDVETGRGLESSAPRTPLRVPVHRTNLPGRCGHRS